MKTHSPHNYVTLIFPDMFLLWKFAQTLNVKSIEINTINKSLICACTEADITRAISQYKAKLSERVNSYSTDIVRKHTSASLDQ